MNQELKESKFDWDKPQETKPRENPPSIMWKDCEVGYTIEGTVKRIASVVVDGKPSMLAEIEDKDIGLCTVWLSTVLENQFVRQQIIEGYYIGIRFLGKAEGKPYYNFDVRVL